MVLNLNDAISFLESLGFSQVVEKGHYIHGLPICHENSDNPFGFCFYPETERWFCFTHGCHDRYGSDLIGLVAAVKKITRSEAKNILAKEIEQVEVDPIDRLVKQELFDLNNIISESLPNEIVKALLANSVQYPYLSYRGFNETTCKKFPTYYCHIIPLKNRVIFPLVESGQVIGFSGRVIDQRKPTWKHFNVHSSSFLFNWDQAIKTGSSTVILTEGIIDCISFVEAGWSNVVAMLGGNLSRYNRIRLIENFETVVLALDNDAAGKRFVAKITPFLEWCRDVKIITPNEKDFGEHSPDEIQQIMKDNEIEC